MTGSARDPERLESFVQAGELRNVVLSKLNRRLSKGASLMTMCRPWMSLLLLIAFFNSSHPIFAQQAGSGSQAPRLPDQGAITIGPGDVLDLTVFHVPELILRIQVDSNGIVSLPLLGDMKLAGLAVRDAQLSIARELVERHLVKNPQVSIFIEESATQGVTVYGEVNTPGIYPLMGPHKLYDAISAAGGLTTKSGHMVTILHARSQGRQEVIDLSGKGPPDLTNVPIYPGDTVIVSKAGVVYVLGEVNKPGGFLMEDNTSMSLLKAVALAGGSTRVASTKHVILIRKSSGTTVEMEISLDRIYHAKATDMPLKAEDIVFVPLSNLKNYGTMGIQGAIQAAVYSIYAVEVH
jgi:polysaccharide biosynthesis/export protein